MKLFSIAAALYGSASGLMQNKKNRPIAKVIKLLEDMRSQLQKEAADDEAVYEKLTCWCETNSDVKSKAIEKANALLKQLNSTIEEKAGAMARFSEKLQNAKDQHTKLQEALQKANELRMEELQAFHDEEKDAIATIKACEQAIVVLSKQHPSMMEINGVVKELKRVNITLVARNPVIKSFLDQPETALVQGPFKSYSSQSGQIFGVLKQMKQDFEDNLAESHADEKQKAESHAQLKAAKQKEIRATEVQISDFDEQLADATAKKAEAEETLVDTEEQLGNDTVFLAKLKEKCNSSDEDYGKRTKSRQEEIDAVNETIAILDNDTAFEAFDKSVNSPSEFLQLRSSHMRKTNFARSSVAKLLKKAGSINNDPRLVLLAGTAQLDAFTKVKKAIDDMVAQLQAEMEDEVKHKDFCNAEFNETDLQHNANDDKRANLEAKINDLEHTIKRLTDEIKTLNAEIAEQKTAMKRATDDRAGANIVFQETVSDQRVTQQILAKALDRMKQKYAFLQDNEEQVGAAHTQTSATKIDPGNGPARFKEYNVKGGGAKVIRMITTVIEDSKKTETEAIRDENDGQIAYEEFVKDGNDSIVSKQRAIVNKTSKKATREEEHSIAEADHKDTLEELDALAEYRVRLHGSCDFVLKNFDIRQASRAEEIEALRQAKGILSGLK